MATFGVAQKTPYPAYGAQKQKPQNYGLSPVAPRVAQYRDPLSATSVSSGAGRTLGAPSPASTGRFSSAGAPGGFQVKPTDYSAQAQEQAGAPVAIPDYTADPALQQITALAMNTTGDARARAMAQRKQLAVDFGDENWARQVTGEDLTAQAARDNPFGVTQQLAKQRDTRTQSLEDSLNKANLFYGGYRGKALSDLENAFVQAQAEAQGRAQGQLGSIEEALLAAEQDAQNRQISAEGDAYWRAIAAGALNNQPDYGGATDQAPGFGFGNQPIPTPPGFQGAPLMSKTPGLFPIPPLPAPKPRPTVGSSYWSPI